MALFNLKAGDSLRIPISVTAAGATTAYDLTGCALSWVAEAVSPAGASISITKSIGSGITVSSLTGGTGYVQLSPSDTNTYTDNVECIVNWDLRLTDATSQVFTIQSGKLVIVPVSGTP